MATISTIEGIGEAYSRKLENAGIHTVDHLLELGSSASGRRAIAKKSGLSEKLILNWVNRADLIRIRGIGNQYADLLEAAGVDSVPELARRNPENLMLKLQEINDTKHLVRAMPYIKQVRKWVDRAQGLPKLVSH
jgi:predicted flap endonuclease-1-like 5' DNA nuclease